MTTSNPSNDPPGGWLAWLELTPRFEPYASIAAAWRKDLAEIERLTAAVPGYAEIGIGRRAYVGGRDGAEVAVDALEAYSGYNYALAHEIAAYIRKAWGMVPRPAVEPSHE